MKSCHFCCCCFIGFLDNQLYTNTNAITNTTPTTTPPTGTTAPSISIVRDGGWAGKIIQSGDPVRFNQDIFFQGTAPSSLIIKVYLNNIG